MIPLILACKDGDDGKGGEPVEGPLGIPLVEDGRFYAGAAVIDITPEVTETFEDLNGDNTFNGSLEDPDGAEPFDDADGNGHFDAVWIGGFGPLRAANEIHDPISVRAVVIAVDGEYVAMVSSDLVGLGHPRIWAARDALAADGFDPARFIGTSSHSHDGPDSVGLWGNPLANEPGFDEAFQERVAAAFEQAVRDAAAAMVPVDLSIGSVRMRDRGPWFNGPYFGGKNPEPRFHGMIRDGRDPVLVSDQLLVMQAVGDAGTVFTLTNWSGHPEVRGSNNNAIGADWPGVTREVLEAEYGGTAIHFAESLGGMQSALGGDLPLVLPDGTHVLATCAAEDVVDEADPDCFGQEEGAPRVDADGDHVPVWAERDSWAFVTSHGWHIAEAAIDALAAGEPLAPKLRVDREQFLLPIENLAYNTFGPKGLFDYALDSVVTDLDDCPEASAFVGCFDPHVFRLEIGRTGPGEGVGFLSVPGELLPEIAWGMPDDPQFARESRDPAQRTPEATYFHQHDPDCQGVVEDYELCRTALALGECDCLTLHAWPYRISDAPHDPLLDHLDTRHRAILGMTDSYFSYIIPEPDFNHAVSLFTDDADHYEDTVSASSEFGDRVLEAHERLAERWTP